MHNVSQHRKDDLSMSWIGPLRSKGQNPYNTPPTRRSPGVDRNRIGFPMIRAELLNILLIAPETGGKGRFRYTSVFNRSREFCCTNNWHCASCSLLSDRPFISQPYCGGTHITFFHTDGQHRRMAASFVNRSLRAWTYISILRESVSCFPFKRRESAMFLSVTNASMVCAMDSGDVGSK